MINSLSIRNFTVFDDVKITFSPKINVIIGENGTGKSHLLKCAYGLCAGNNRYVTGTADPSRDELDKSLTTTLVRLFLPLDESIAKLRKTGADDRAVLSAVFSHDAKLRIGFNHNSQKVSIEQDQNYLQYAVTPVFIPTKEVLSFMKGFTSLYERFGLSFDQTYNDIILALDLPELRPEQLQAKARWAMDAIEALCGGKFVFYGGGKVTFKTRDAEYSANAMAEGFRKAGLLSRLLHTGAIQPGVSGPLFWDEPESNLNPKLMRLLVEILLELSRHGQQVIVATHSYVFMKWFDLLCKAEFEDHVRFHSLYRTEEGKVKVESTDDYTQVQHNAVDDAYGDLTNEQIAQDMGGIGR
jgi:energy-coupling factor transporter ATP-binding protein EcfA2